MDETVNRLLAVPRKSVESHVSVTQASQLAIFPSAGWLDCVAEAGGSTDFQVTATSLVNQHLIGESGSKTSVTI